MALILTLDLQLEPIEAQLERMLRSLAPIFALGSDAGSLEGRARFWCTDGDQ